MLPWENKGLQASKPTVWRRMHSTGLNKQRFQPFKAGSAKELATMSQDWKENNKFPTEKINILICRVA